MRRISRVGFAAMLAAAGVVAQEHRWAGRELDNFELAIHGRLAALPSHGVFDTLNFEVRGKVIILSGQVLNENVRQKAERAVGQLDGVETVVNRIEVLPPSKRDDALRMNIYRAIYESNPLEKYGTRTSPSIQIIVKNGWVTLQGVVDSDADRSMAHVRALKVTVHVSDNLRVAPEGV